MARLVVLLTSLLACAAGIAAPAPAATPAEGTVSAEAPDAKWTGAVTDPVGAGYSAAAQSGSAADVCSTPTPACDAYSLNVTAGDAARLTVAVSAESADDWLGLSLTTPAGEERVVFDDASKAALTIENPPPGAYAIRVLASPALPVEVAYSGAARLELPPPPSPPPPPPAPAEPSPAPAAEQPAQPPVQAGPRELAVEADVRRVVRAVRKGFRARVVCRGGCATVRLRVFVSSLTARTYRLANAKGDVHVGGARVLRDAEGRRTATITFKKSARRKLARAKNLALAVEAVARDADGRVRRVTKRIVLPR